ncbi:hypothetical protein PHET_00423 [Paragonimus heterotremus]|uniref:Fibronectin type-III domain-containing protein n=1 Tax=Paragonimus heterotremus TaxID=100268 RepID=A0A8J4TSQ9_9TREM|nr:hypothetical protein PHET_00423 [Paragonimus heterotremus]
MSNGEVNSVVCKMIEFLLLPSTLQTNLLRLPQTHTGHYAEVRSIEGHCVPGAMSTVQNQDRLFTTLRHYPISGDQHSINAFCMANGKWHLNTDAHCFCKPGHEKHSQGEICRACTPGTYKPRMGNEACTVCPLNSIAREAGQTQCVCLSGYFRLASEGTSEDDSCFGLPSVPRNLNAIRINGTAVVLTWDKPIRTGGFNTTEFRIGCQGCIPDRVKYTPGNVLNGTKVQVDGLQPMTRYQFDVYAQNPVSGLADAMWNNVASVIVTTGMGMQTKVG